MRQGAAPPQMKGMAPVKRRWFALSAVALLVGVPWVVLASGCLVAPLAKGSGAEDTFAAAPRSEVKLTVEALRTASASAPRCAAAGQASCLGTIEVRHAAFLVRHPRGNFLVDASFASNAESQVARFGFFERQALAFKRTSSLHAALKAAQEPKIDFVLLTHAHWDHTNGLQELDHPRVVVGPGEQELIASYPREGAQPIVMPDHLRGANVESFKWDGPAYENFPASHDWFGDGSVVLVPLPGHTPGSIGVFLQQVAGKRVLLVGDAAWSMDAISLPSHKLKPLSALTDADQSALAQTLWRLHRLHERDPSLVIIPSHDGAAIDALPR